MVTASTLLVVLASLSVSLGEGNTVQANAAGTAVEEEVEPVPVSATVAKKEKIHVYTNADLQRFEPLPAQAFPIAHATLPGQISSGGDADWNTIMAFIDRERAYEERRREQGESYALAREEMKQKEMAANQYLGDGTTYGGYLGYYGGGYGGGGCGGGRGCGVPVRHVSTPYYFAPLPRWSLGPPTTFIGGPRMSLPAPHPTQR